MEAMAAVLKTNKRVVPLLDTTTKTPALATKLIGLAKQMLSVAPKQATEMQISPMVTSLAGDLELFAQHKASRPFDDPLRQAAHGKLCRSYTNTLSKLVALLNSKRPIKSQLSLPTKEDSLYAFIQRAIDQKDFTLGCSGCGKTVLFKDGVLASKTAYCSKCADRYTYQCPSCLDRHERDGASAGRVVRDNNAPAHTRDGSCDLIFCGKCADQAKSDFSCSDCNCKVLGPPGESMTLSAEDIARETKKKLCYCCSRNYRRAGGCGHVCGRTHGVRTIEHVEDDNRDRDNITDATVEYCHKCYAENRHAEPVEHWTQKRPSVVGRTYDDIRSKRSFGVEIEVCQARGLHDMPMAIKEAWNSKHDDSLPRDTGVEFASTILYGDAGLKVIKDLCDYGKQHRWAANGRAGYHLHIGLEGEPVSAHAAIAMGYHMTYKMWASFVAASRQRCKYCRRNGYHPADLSKMAPEEVIKSLLHDPALPSNERRRVWINWHSYSAHKTVENRFHHATLDYEKIANWVKANIRFVDWCVSVGDHKKVFEMLSEKDTRQQFLLVSKLAWKDSTLTRWLRKRSQILHGAASFLAPSNRTLRKQGQEPKKYAPKASSTVIEGREAFAVPVIGRDAYIIIDNPAFGNHRYSIGTGGWVTRNGVQFTTRDAADTFLRDAASVGVQAAFLIKSEREDRGRRLPAGTYHAVLTAMMPIRTGTTANF